MWKDIVKQGGMGIIDIINVTEPLYKYAGPGHWLDMDMLIVGLDGRVVHQAIWVVLAAHIRSIRPKCLCGVCLLHPWR